MSNLNKASVSSVLFLAACFSFAGDASSAHESEPEPVARIVYRGNSPFVELNGKLHEPIFNICQVGDQYNESAIVRLSEKGFDIVQLNFFADDFYKGDGRPYNFTLVSNRVSRLLEINPDAYVVISPRFIMKSWAQAHPDEQVGYETGAANPDATDEFRSRVLRPSPASDMFRELVVDMIEKLGEYVSTQPWRKRMVGFRLSYGTYSEWSCFGMYEGPDNGLRMKERFRAYMKAKRNVDDAEIPTLAMRRHEYTDSSQPNKNGDLLDPVEDQLVLDYYDCFANTVADLLLAMADAAKRAFPGRLVGAYYGYLYDDHPPEGATSLLDKVLASPSVDMLSCPAYYSKDGRRAGGSFVTRTIPSLFRRYGKLSLLEDDSRFHHICDWLQSQNDGLNLCTETPRETEMCMRRNWLNQFFDGGGIQLNDPITQSGQRPHAFDDPSVLQAISDSRVALAKAGVASPQSGNDVAVVFSAREAIRRDGGKCSYFTWNLYQTSLLFLNRSGIAFDLLSLEDYIANPRGYKIVMFLNAFYLTPEERAKLVLLTRQSGMTAIWIGPAGGVTDNGFDDGAMSALTSVTAEGVARRSKIVCRDSTALRRYTANAVYHVKTLSGVARSIIVPEMPAGSAVTGPDEYAMLLKAAGAHQYVPSGSYFRRHGDVYMYHTGTNGSYTITFSDDIVKVRELFTGEVYNSNVVTLTADGPSTWLFRAVSANSVPIGELLSGDAAVSRFPERLREMGLHTAKWMQLTNGVEYYYGRFSDLLGNVDGFTGSRNDLHMLRIDYARAPVKMKFVDHTQTYTKRWTTSKTAAQHNALFAVNMTMEDGSGHPQGYAKADGAVIPNGSETSHVTDGFAFNDDKTFKFDMRWLGEDPATGRAKADAWENVVTHEAYTVHNGVAAFGAGATYFSRHNYAFFGTTADGVLWVCTVDGRCDDSEGLGYHEVAALQVELGCTEGICCDGGGSTTMAIRKDLMTVPDICATQKTSRDSAEYYTMNYLSGRQVMGINVGAGQEREVINQLLFVESPDDPREGGCFCIIFR